MKTPLARWFELRWAFSWAWLLPIALVLASLLLTRVTFHQPGPYQPAAESSGPIPQGTLGTIAPNYASALRDDLERYLPLVGVLLTVSLIGQEWRWGTLVQVALRKPLRWVLLERLSYVLAYIVLVTLIAVPISVGMTSNPPGTGTIFSWLWDTLLIVFPPTLLLMAVGLLVAHSTVSSIAGYMVPISGWLGNIIFAQFVANAGNKNDALLYTLFGWSYRSATFHPNGWLAGKFLLLCTALLLLLVQLPLLRQEARLIRNVEE